MRHKRRASRSAPGWPAGGWRCGRRAIQMSSQPILRARPRGTETDSWDSTRLNYLSFPAECDRREAPEHRDLGARIGRALDVELRPDQVRLFAQAHHAVMPGAQGERIEADAVVLDPQRQLTAADGLQGHD